MSVDQLDVKIEYPESDGKPMGETDLHRTWMIYNIDALQRYFRGQHVYVSGNNFIYYVENDPKKSVSPDTYVVRGCSPEMRNVFKTWVEGRVPNVAIETTSNSTKRIDRTKKPKIYASIGVKEYFLFDPTSDYLNPPLQGYRLDGGEYVRIEPDASGALECQELGLQFQVDQDGRFAMYDQSTGERLLSDADAEQARADTAEAALARMRQKMLAEGLDPDSIEPE